MSTSLKPTESPPTEAESKVLAPIEPEATEPEAIEPEATEVQPLKGLDRLRSNKWLMGLVMLIPIMGVSYFAYRQVVIVPICKQKVRSKRLRSVGAISPSRFQPMAQCNLSDRSMSVQKQPEY